MVPFTSRPSAVAATAKSTRDGRGIWVDRPSRIPTIQAAAIHVSFMALTELYQPFVGRRARVVIWRCQKQGVTVV